MRRSPRRTLCVLGLAVAAVAILLGVRNIVATAPLEKLKKEVRDQQTVYRGSWQFPRGGPYVLGFQCADGCSLRVDGRHISRGRGVKTKRVVFAAGVYELEFTAAESARLVWHPPGRRGPPEYVPASSLSPAPPAEAQFSSGAGAARFDGAIALSILFIVVFALTFLLRGVWRTADPSEQTRWIEVVAVFAVALAIRLLGLGDAGQTWDEDVNWSAGRNYVSNLLSLEFSNEAWIWNYEHPPLMKYIVGIGGQFADGYGPARALCAVMMSLACALLVPIAAKLRLTNVGLVAGVIAALSPHLVGHGQIVGHESAMALTWMAAILAALCVWPTGSRTRLELRLALCGAAVGLAIASRFVNGLVGPLVFAIVVLRAPSERRLETAWKGALIMPTAAVAVFVLLWPRMWSEPFAHLSEAWKILKKPHMPEPFLGEVTNNPSRAYFAIYLVATAPLGLLLFALGGFAWLTVARRRTLVVVMLWMALSMVVMFSPVRQDGVRYIIPALLALALLAGIGVRAASELLPKPLRAIPAALLAVYLGVVCIAIRPYFIDYYGEHVGGPAGVAAAKRFEVGWWGEGIGEAVEYINANAELEDRVYKRCVAPAHLTWLRTDLWRHEAKQPAVADWALVYSPAHVSCPLPAGLELVYEVSAAGAPLARVYRRLR